LNWPGAAPVAAANGIGDPTKFSLDFAGIDQQAIVISADPYFYHQREYLIAAANASAKYICYPLLSYKNVNGDNRPAIGRTTLFGPELYGQTGGYYLMGQRASSFLSSGITRFVTRLSAVTVDV
jgi:hypothetical protein